MKAVEVLLQELEHEAKTTRRVLERVPGDHLAWKPHAKSMSLGQLALHVATVPGNVAEIAARPTFAVTAFTQASASTAAELLPALDESIAKARRVLGGMALPRAAFLRSIMLNHWYHHRGQLSVYLRELNVPVPSIYGPSADENPFG
jgi:uncharacterized damage-inducible protein DinB